ncbi:hypothetical protein FPV67DRAFT_1449113 [Lyophyllum atratum]|nr:hypothetical protein FPV67DRAFT_1449113 [Lyophyllum atratum]
MTSVTDSATLSEGQETLVDPQDLSLGSPFGWHSDGIEHTANTIDNNVGAFVGEQVSVESTAELNFNVKYNDMKNPTDASNIQAATNNAFSKQTSREGSFDSRRDRCVTRCDVYRYIPPHRRNAGTPATLVLQGRRSAYTNEAIVSRLNLIDDSHWRTLRGQDDTSLSAIIVPAHAHPDYHSTPSQLFCHSNLCMLEGSIGNEYPVFESTRNAPGSPWARRFSRETFEFAGWVRIAEVVYHEPHTPELIAMLERKFGNKARSEDNWRKSLHMRWAVVTVEKVEGRDTNPML